MTQTIRRKLLEIDVTELENDIHDTFKLSPVAIVLICVASAITVAVITTFSIRAWLKHLKAKKQRNKAKQIETGN